MANVQIQNITSASSTDAVNDYFVGYNNATTAYRKYNRNILLGITGSPVGSTDTQTVSAKTFTNTNAYTAKSTSFTLQDVTDNTKQAQFSLAAISTATTRTYTLPNISATLASLTGVETFTNKTLTSPAISGGTISNASITVDAITGFTTSTVVTVGGVQLNNGTIGTSNAVTTASVADSAITPAKLLTGTGTGWSWQAWTPTWTNATVGNGTVVAKYCQIGKATVCRLSFVLGSSSTISGLITFSLPVTAVAYPNIANGVDPFGLAAILDSGTATYSADIRTLTTTTAIVTVFGAAGTYVNGTNTSSSVPMVWTTGDALTTTFIYEAA